MDALKRDSDKGLGMAKYVLRLKWNGSLGPSPTQETHFWNIHDISHHQEIVTKLELRFVQIDVYDVVFTNLSEP